MSAPDRKVRVVVAGQVPPPVGGQNLNIARLLELLGQEPGLEVRHWVFRFTPEWSAGRKGSLYKVAELVRVMARLVRLRLAGPIDVLLYPSGGPHTVPIVRDIVLLPWANLWARKVVVHFHAAGIDRRLPELPALLRVPLRWAHRLCAGAVTLTEFGRRDAAALGMIDIEAIPLAVEDTDWARENAGKRTLPRGEVPVLLHAGHLCQDKGTPDLLEACAIARERGAPPFRLRLAGECTPPYSPEQLRADIARHGLEDTVELAGLLRGEELLQAFREADLFVFSTRAPYESFGMVMIEAMRAGLPIIATDWRANAEVLGPDFGGRLCPVAPVSDRPPDAAKSARGGRSETGATGEGDLAHHLADALTDVLAHRNEWTAWGRRNRETYLARYTLDRLRAAMAACLRRHAL